MKQSVDHPIDVLIGSFTPCFTLCFFSSRGPYGIDNVISDCRSITGYRWSRCNHECPECQFPYGSNRMTLQRDPQRSLPRHHLVPANVSFDVTFATPAFKTPICLCSFIDVSTSDLYYLLVHYVCHVTAVTLHLRSQSITS